MTDHFIHKNKNKEYDGRLKRDKTVDKNFDSSKKYSINASDTHYKRSKKRGQEESEEDKRTSSLHYKDSINSPKHDRSDRRNLSTFRT